MVHATKTGAAKARSGPAKAPKFYRAETYQAEESVGYLMRRILSTIAHEVESSVSSPGARRIRSGCRCTSCTPGGPAPWPNWHANANSTRAP